MNDHEFGLTRRAWLAGAAGIAAGAGLAARGPRSAFAQGAPKRGGTLRVATVDKPVKMEPGHAQLYSSLQIYQNVYNKLAYVDEAGQFIPGLAKPFGPLLAMLTQATEIVNEKALKDKDPKLFPIGTGPYRFVEWVKDDHVTLERWDKYFRPGRPYVDRIIFSAPADDTLRLTGLQTGRFNWIQTVPPQRIPELERGRDPRASAGRPYLPFFLMLNASKPPFNDRRLRQAIAWTIDRAEIVKLVYFGSHVATAEPTPETSPG